MGHGNRNVVVGEEFQEQFSSYGIESQPTTVKNLMAQAVIEHVHLTLSDQLCIETFYLNKF